MSEKGNDDDKEVGVHPPGGGLDLPRGDTKILAQT